MYRAVAYALVAIVMVCFLTRVIVPVISALDVTVNTVARTLNQGADDVAK